MKNQLHGLSRSRIYKIWANMKTRCSNPNTPYYKNYGGRGVKVCVEWQRFDAFFKWAKQSGYSDNLTIERKDTDGGYYPSNCCWIPREEQPLNQRFPVGVSGYRGVHPHGPGWKAQVKVKGKKHNLGTYPTPEEAAKVRDTFVLANKLNRHLNFSGDDV